MLKAYIMIFVCLFSEIAVFCVNFCRQSLEKMLH